MSNDKTLGNQRHISTSGGKDYCHPIRELLATESDGSNLLTVKLTK